MVVLLRAWNWVSLLLVFIWSWYYLGSQAAQREYTYALSAPFTDTRIAFEVSNGPSIFDDLTNITSINQKVVDGRWFTSMNTIAENPTDTEGSAIAPLLIQAPDVKMDRIDENGWLKFDYTMDGTPRYSSSLGRAVWSSTEFDTSNQWLGTYVETFNLRQTGLTYRQIHGDVHISLRHLWRA